MRDLPRNLKDAGYAYAARPSFDAAPGRITAFRAAPAGKGDSLLGMWIQTDTKNILLAWTARRPDSPAGKDPLGDFELLPMRRGLRPRAGNEERAAAPAKARACCFLTPPGALAAPVLGARLTRVSCAGGAWAVTSRPEAISSTPFAENVPDI